MLNIWTLIFGRFALGRVDNSRRVSCLFCVREGAGRVLMHGLLLRTSLKNRNSPYAGFICLVRVRL
jgi:hypothetical protein